MQVKKTLRSMKGITLIELMVVLLIIGILGAIAYPSYVSYVQEARRADAMAQLLELQMAQEEWRLRNSSYADLPSLSVTPSSQYYSFSASNVGAETYTLTATATGSQTGDVNCTSISLNHNDEKTPAECW